MTKRMLAICKNEMMAIDNGDGTVTTMDLKNGVSYLRRDGVLQIIKTHPMCCDNPSPVNDMTGNAYLSSGEYDDNLLLRVVCENCGAVLWDEREPVTELVKDKLAF